MKKDYTQIFARTVMSLIVLILIASVLVTKDEVTCKRVILIGACNKDARCSVQYDDGSYDKTSYPIAGAKVCKISRVARWKYNDN